MQSGRREQRAPELSRPIVRLAISGPGPVRLGELPAARPSACRTADRPRLAKANPHAGQRQAPFGKGPTPMPDSNRHRLAWGAA